MSFPATLSSTMPQGFSSSDTTNRQPPSRSSLSNHTPSDDGTLFSRGDIAQWVADSAIAPSQDLQNFIAQQKPDFKLDASATPLPEPRKRTRRGATQAVDDVPAKIPRPPNAFMIFRSDLIKDVRMGLQKVEKKQQNLSVMAGEIWNLMPEVKKQLWRDKATDRLHEHQAKHPQYKYAPKQRNGRGKKAGKEPSPPSFADPAVREQWREKLPEVYRGPALPPSRPRRRGAQPYEVPTRASQERAGPSSAPEEPQWHHLTMPARPSSNPAEEYYPPPSVALSDHMAMVYSCPPLALPRSAHSSPGSTHSAPAYFPPDHNTLSGPQLSFDVQPPMASLLEPTSSFEPVPRPASEPTEAQLQDMISSFPPPDFLIPNADYNFGMLGYNELGLHGGYGEWSAADAQGLADNKPEGDAFGNVFSNDFAAMLNAGPEQLMQAFPLSSQYQNALASGPSAHGAPGA
ncbi:hypothetical protein PENSPDRAFT_681116 [Peniophora sp. CONT]|nr:hypothetical protein PENSPDRAFT_681116 [Peniophora sp. CONT]